MLTTLVLGSFLFLIFYLETKKWYNIALHLLLFAMALFTKESGIILPLITLGYLLLLTHTELKNYLLLIVGFMSIGCTWFYIRSISTPPIIKPTVLECGEGFINRLPLFIHYIGKSFLPFNLSVFPMQADTSIYKITP